MMEYIDIESLNPAEYNPRLLTPEAHFSSFHITYLSKNVA